VVADPNNRSTAMDRRAGRNPGTGETCWVRPLRRSTSRKLVIALGVKPANVRVVGAYDLKAFRTVLKEELDKPEAVGGDHQRPVRAPAPGEEAAAPRRGRECTACGQCIRVGCIALSMEGEGDGKHAAIDPNFCAGCTVCAQVCKFDAIRA